MRQQHGPSSQSQAGGEGHSRLHPWHQVDHQHRGCPAERKRKRRVTLGLAGWEAKGQGAVGCHLQQDQQHQQDQGDRAHHGHLGDLHCHELPGDQFHPGEEEEGGRSVSMRAALKPLTWLISASICSSFPMEAKPGEMPTGLGCERPRLPRCPRQQQAHSTLGFLVSGYVGKRCSTLGLSPPPHAPSFHQFVPALEMPPGRRWSGRSYLSTSSTGEARGTSRTSWTLDRRKGMCQRSDPTLPIWS